MGKRLEIDGYDVVICVPVRNHGNLRFDKRTAVQAERAAGQIRAAVLRHLGHDFGHDMEGVSVVRDARPVCEHCGAEWTEKDDSYNGGCCEKDVETGTEAAAQLAGAP